MKNTSDCTNPAHLGLCFPGHVHADHADTCLPCRSERHGDCLRQHEGQWWCQCTDTTHGSAACEWCGRAVAQNTEGRWYAVKGEERGYDPLTCDASADCRHSPGEAPGICDAVTYVAHDASDDYDTEVRCTERATAEVVLADRRLHRRCAQHVPARCGRLGRTL